MLATLETQNDQLCLDSLVLDTDSQRRDASSGETELSVLKVPRHERQPS